MSSSPSWKMTGSSPRSPRPWNSSFHATLLRTEEMTTPYVIHRFLGEKRILRNICDYLRGHFRNETLSALAVSCKAFQDPALDALWFTQTSFVPLVKCLPEDVWEERTSITDSMDHDEVEENGTSRFRTLHLRRTPALFEWDRAMTYAHRIRALNHCPSHDDCDLDLDVYRALSMIGTPPILPRLQDLRWNDTDNETFPFIYMLIGPLLSRLSVLLNTDVISIHAISTLLMSLRSTSAQLQVLNITHTAQSNRGQLGDALSALVCTLTQLQELRSSFSLTPTAIRYLSTLPKLRDLDVANDANDFLLSLSGDIPRATLKFAHLTSLCLEGDIASCTRVLALIQPVFLEELSLRHTKHVPISSSTQQLFLSLPTLCSQHRFKTLLLYHSVTEDMSLDSEDFITFAMFRPLFVFKNFRHLDVKFPVQVTSTSFHDMAVSWPCLQELHLDGCFSLRNSPVNLTSLLPLSVHCPDLEHLTLSLRVSIDDVFALLPRVGERRLRNYMLRVLSLGASDIATEASSADVATILSDVFPSLEDIVLTCPSGAEDVVGQQRVDVWKNVERLLSANVDMGDMGVPLEAIALLAITGD